MQALGLSGADDQNRTDDLLITNQHISPTWQVAEGAKSFTINTAILYPSAPPINYTYTVRYRSTMSYGTTRTKIAQSAIVRCTTVVVSFALHEPVLLAASSALPNPAITQPRRKIKPRVPLLEGTRNRANENRDKRRNECSCIEGEHGPRSAVIAA